MVFRFTRGRITLTKLPKPSVSRNSPLNQPHSCGRYDLESHFRGKLAEIRPLYERSALRPLPPLFPLKTALRLRLRFQLRATERPRMRRFQDYSRFFSVDATGQYRLSSFGAGSTAPGT